MYSIEVFSQTPDTDEPCWWVYASDVPADETKQTYDRACREHEGMAVILRGPDGELLAKRSAPPVGLDVEP